MTNMKKASFITIATFASAMLLGLTGCGNTSGGGSTTKKFSFDLALDSGRNSILYVHADGTSGVDKLRIKETNPDPKATYSYEFTLYGDEGVTPSEYVTAALAKDDKGQYVSLTPKKETIRTVKEIDEETGKEVETEQEFYLTISVKEANTRKPKTYSFKNVLFADPTSGGRNYSSQTSARQEILGKLEEYAMENYLTGISLFENGGYIRFSDRVRTAASEYITGYGWGILAEGRLEGSLPQSVDKPTYLQTSSSSDPLSINAWDATGSQVSDLNSYISGSYWGTRMKGTKAYEWYPSLAKDTITVDGQTVAFNEPLHVGEDNDLGLYKRWRIYVKTGDEGGIAYRTNSAKHKDKYDNRPVALEDYVTVFQALLSQESQVVRGSELAGDTSYGIKGGQTYYKRSKGHDDNVYLDNLWKQMTATVDEQGKPKEQELGILTGHDDIGGDYIEIELVNPIDSFTAMYTLSSNLYTPIPKEFLTDIGGGKFTEGTRLFGTKPSSTANILDYTLCIGPFYLESWVTDVEQIFARNDSWYETELAGGSRYHIPGVRIRVITQATQDDTAIYQHFTNGELDQTGIPASIIKKGEGGEAVGDLKSGGDSTFKLNVNSCDQDRWNEIFGTNGTNIDNRTSDNDYKVKPWMSNKNFLKGLYWSIDRASFAKARGVNPSFNYFSGSYLSDPQRGVSYNTTEEHARAVRNFHNTWIDEEGNTVDDYGYDLDTSVKAFHDAVEELVASGDIKLPSTISIHIRWMYESDITDYGDEIASYIKAAFEDERVSDGQVKINIVQEAVKQWDHVYTKYLMTGHYDLGFGAISGNTYNPLNFLEVLKSDNSSGFTLNWGTDTSKVDEVSPIIYNGTSWSFDAVWAAADHGTIVDEGKDVNPVENCYKENNEGSVNDLYNGGSFDIVFNFVGLEDAESVEFELNNFQIYLAGHGGVVIGQESMTRDGNVYHITISPALGAQLNQYLVDDNDLEKEAAKPKYSEEEKFNILHPFTLDKYDMWWNIEVRYSMRINHGFATENVFNCYKNKTEQDANKKN